MLIMLKNAALKSVTTLCYLKKKMNEVSKMKDC